MIDVRQNARVDDPHGWTFSVTETSYGAWLVIGRDADGRSVSLHGDDPERLLDEARAWARLHAHDVPDGNSES